ncbi:TrbC/VirB2 family protein [Gloeobacter morelensis]|uniref:TrbC/VirB2 family protein n=1 Tax=Gloeobacter morelensis MG652769 TaxID=2781736 RepID=A0ABY3PS47_9CYAN|nr:TrbC/VirB2 family protein [Gloeobacter morelensis]UFP96557.1 TrbC/VirB2 family protein [Gloeobacter morelensis MG652769]
MAYLSRRRFGCAAMLAGVAASMGASPAEAGATSGTTSDQSAPVGGIGAFVVELPVGDRTARFVLDTGERRSWISAESAVALGLAGTGETVPATPDLDIEAAGVRASLAVGQSAVDIPLIAVESLDGLTDLSRDVDGILGASTLGLFESVQLSGDTLALGASSTDAASYPIESLDAGRGSVILAVVGSDGTPRPLRFLVHTGSPFTFLLKTHADALGLPALTDDQGNPIAGTLHLPGNPTLPVVAGTVEGVGEVHFAVHHAPMAAAEGIDGTLGADALNTPMGNVLQTVVDWMTGNTGKGLATLAITVVGIGAFFGKVSWGMALIVALGLALVFSALGLVKAFALPAAPAIQPKTFSPSSA